MAPLLGLGIDFDIKFHPPLGSIEESLAYWGKFEATHCKNLLNAPRSFHPNDNMGTIIISQKDFIKFLEAMGNEYEFVELYD